MDDKLNDKEITLLKNIGKFELILFKDINDDQIKNKIVDLFCDIYDIVMDYYNTK